MAFCTACGAQLGGRQRFCPQCGAPRATRAQTQAPLHPTRRAARWLGAGAGHLVARAINPLIEQARTSAEGPLARETGPYLVQLQASGPRASAVSATLRTALGLDARSAKALVASAPVVLLDHVSAETAEALAARLRAAGADAEIAIDG